MELIDLIDGWCGEVARFWRQSGMSLDESPDAWGVDDLAGAYHTRKRIEFLLGEEGGWRPHCLALADELHRHITVERTIDWARFTGVSGGEEWWWSRFPSSGPVAEELACWEQ